MNFVQRIDELLRRKGEVEVTLNDAITLLERAANMLLHGTQAERRALAGKLIDFVDEDENELDPELDAELGRAMDEMRAAFRVPSQEEKDKAMMAELIRTGEAEAFICQSTGKVNYRLTKPKEGSK